MRLQIMKNTINWRIPWVLRLGGFSFAYCSSIRNNRALETFHQLKKYSCQKSMFRQQPVTNDHILFDHLFSVVRPSFVFISWHDVRKRLEGLINFFSEIFASESDGINASGTRRISQEAATTFERQGIYMEMIPWRFCRDLRVRWLSDPYLSYILGKRVKSPEASLHTKYCLA